MDSREQPMGEEKQNIKLQKQGKRKSPWRFVFLLLALAAGYDLLGSVLAVFLLLRMGDPVGTVSEAASIGIIGGADGPTAVFVTYSAPNYVQLLAAVLLLAVGIVGYCRLKHDKKKE